MGCASEESREQSCRALVHRGPWEETQSVVKNDVAGGCCVRFIVCVLVLDSAMIQGLRFSNGMPKAEGLRLRSGDPSALFTLDGTFIRFEFGHDGPIDSDVRMTD